MDKHYGWQEGRGAQNPAGRAQNGQRWNERYRDDDRDTRAGRGSEYGWDDESRSGSRGRFTSGADLDREDYGYEGPDDSFGSPRQGQWGPRWQGEQGRGREFGSQFGNQSFQNERFRRQGSNQGFSGGHYGGFANEGYSGQGGYGNRGFSNAGDSGQGYGQASGARGGQSWTQPWGQGNREFQSGPRASGQGYGTGYAPGSSGLGYAGRGPKGYQRSDDRLKEQVSDRLMDDDDIDATEIVVEVKNGEVTLTGMVGSRQEKRAAEDAAEQTPGVREVQNHLRVHQQWGTSGQSASGTGRQDSFSKSQDSAPSTGSRSKSTERE